MRSKHTYIPQQYTCSYVSKSPSIKTSHNGKTTKRSISKSDKNISKSKFLTFDSTSKQSFYSPTQQSRQKFISIKNTSRPRSITHSSNFKDRKQKERQIGIQKFKQKSKSKSKIKSKGFKSPTNTQRLAKQNLMLRKALKQSQQQKIMLSEKLQFFKSNVKSPPKPQNIPKLNELTNLVKSLKKTYEQKQLSKLSTESLCQNKPKKNNGQSEIEEAQISRNKISSIIKTIQSGLIEIQGHRQLLHNFSSKK